MQKYFTISIICLCAALLHWPFGSSAQAIEVELGSPKSSSSVRSTPQNLKGSFGVAWQHQQRANQSLEIGNNARAIEYFRKAIAAYQDSIRRKIETTASQKGVQDSQAGLKQASGNLDKQTNTQSILFRYLEEKVGKPVQIPVFPPDNLIAWYEEKFVSVGEDSQARYTLIYQVSLIAKSLLEQETIDQKLRGLRIARDSAVFTLDKLKDEKLSAMLCDTFLLPNLGAARNKRWQQLSKEQILENVIYIYSKAGEGEKLVTACKLLLDNANSANATDSARLKLALALESQFKYEEAIDYLEAITSPNMSGAKKLIIRMKQKATQSKKQEARNDETK